MSWTKVLAETDLPAGTRQVIEVEKRKILLLNHEGQLHALDNACPHLKLPLKKGKITADGAIVCPWHRSAFDLATGSVKAWCTWPPVMGKVMSAMSEAQAVSVFPVRVDAGSIWIDI
jgi:nitrite reductase/ring-hydroxylating ferredoxin subunit